MNEQITRHLRQRFDSQRELKPTVDDFILWMFTRAMEDFAAETPEEYRNIRSDCHALCYGVRTPAAMKTLASTAAASPDVELMPAAVQAWAS